MTSDERAKLKGLIEEARGLVSNDDSTAYQRHNRAFHFMIYEGSHNSYLIGQATSLYDRIALYRAYELKREGEVKRVFEEHEGIVEAINKRDGERAAQLLRSHTMPDMDLLGDLIASSGLQE